MRGRAPTVSERQQSLSAASLPRVRVSVVREAKPLYLDQVQHSATVFRLLREEFAELDRERFVTLALDGKHRIVSLEEVSTGTLSASLVHPREVMKGLILQNAASFICAHNHPSGEATPSAEDLDITRRLKAAGELIGITLLDHIIFGDGSYVSFADEGLL